MRRTLLILVLAAGFPVIILGQKEDREGRAWLEANHEAAAFNVTGIWRSADWGRVPLNQREGGRRIIGSGDGWDLSGIVSGNMVYLLFSHKGKVAYSAKLAVEGPAVLTGVYASGLLASRSKTRPMRLTK
jgi:hypothetical protein